MDETELCAKRARKLRCPEIDTTLVEWVNECSKNVPINYEIIKHKAIQLSINMNISNPPKISPGWFQKYCLRHKFRRVILHGEGASVAQNNVEEFLPPMQAEIATFDSRDVFNFGETGLFYCQKPKSTISSTTIHGTKQAKDRITIALCTNATGCEKLPLLYIGKSRKPRCFGKKTPQQSGYC